AFNEEPVARAIASATAPVITGVGHETDVTIADLVADQRAPTPSAAAERAVPDRVALHAGLGILHRRMAGGLVRDVRRRASHLEGLGERLERAIQLRLRDGRRAIQLAAARLEALSPLDALRRGY